MKNLFESVIIKADRRIKVAKMVDINTMRTTINEGNSRFVPFQEVFWKFVKTEVGITHIQKEKHSYLKKQVSCEERQKKIDMLL